MQASCYTGCDTGDDICPRDEDKGSLTGLWQYVPGCKIQNIELRCEPQWIQNFANRQGLRSVHLYGDSADVTHARSSDMIQRIIARDRMGHDAESQGYDKEDAEGEETVYGDGSSSSINEE